MTGHPPALLRSWAVASARLATVLLVRDAGFSVAALVAETNDDLRDQLGPLGLERPG